MIVATQLGTAQAAEPSVAQLFEIKEILGQNDVAALRTYLEQYPELLEGDTQLAVLLRKFLLDAKHLPNYLLSDLSRALRRRSRIADPRRRLAARGRIRGMMTSTERAHHRRLPRDGRAFRAAV